MMSASVSAMWRTLLSPLVRLHRDRRAIAMTEFAIVAPTFLALGMLGAELAYMASVKMQINQLALSVADNAARLGQSDNSGVAPTINETDVQAVLQGALYQARALKFKEHGRIILSSLEYDQIVNKQWIHWQRCAGDKTLVGRYGTQSVSASAAPAMTGMGAPGSEITATEGQAVMFVEVEYDFQKLFPNIPLGQSAVFRAEAALIVRDDRNLTGLSGSNLSPCN